MTISPTENIKDALLTIAKKHSIDIYFLDMKPNTPDVSSPKDKIVIMNNGFSNKATFVYRLAHELSHVLYGDSDAQAVYQFSEYGKRGEELLAHRNAIRLLMSIEFPTSVHSFMEYYRIPYWLESDASKTFLEFNTVE